MKERPILFNGDMVRAILDGRKTQTRRTIKDQPETGEAFITGKKGLIYGEDVLTPEQYSELCPFGKPGDRLWVRETCYADYETSSYVALAKYSADNTYVSYDHDENHKNCAKHWWYSKDTCPSIHMPRWASRILLEITGVRVERLNDISKEDAAAEGFDYPVTDGMDWKMGARHNFKVTWDSIYKNWNQNPWVWVIEFKKVEA